jgi:perosamine synthetase
MIPLSVPSLNGNEWKYIKECLDTNWVSSAGKYVDLFEQKIAEYTGAKYAVACVNGTAALQLSLQLAGVRSGDEVIAPTLTFIAPINAIAYNNAIPVFMDADQYYNIDSEKTIEFIKTQTSFRIGATYNSLTGNRISAIIPVHIWGNAVWLDDLVELCNERNIRIIEDASESLGTFYSEGVFAGRHTGTIGKLGCISFNGNKIITTGGGGMILTDDLNLAEKAKYLSTQAKDDPIRYVHDEIGYNFRLTNIQAALGVAQLEQLPDFILKKKKIHKEYSRGFMDSDMTLAESPDYSDSNFWLNVGQFTTDGEGDKVSSLMRELSLAGIQARPIWGLNHLQKPYIENQSYQISNAVQLWESSICLPSSVSLNKQNINRVISIING